METQEDINQLADAIYRDKVLRARKLTMDEKLSDGFEMFDLSCRLMADGVRYQLGLTDEQEVWRAVAKRLSIVRKMDEASIYTRVTHE